MICTVQLFAAILTLVISCTLAASTGKEESTCAQDAHGSSEPPAFGSLLQKRVGKSTLTQEQQPVSEENLYNTTCNGTQAQGRCWFLSELGESCATTCESQGRHFSYVISDPKHPVMPQLVEHTPKVKDQPWAALECYVPSEDRYHPANENSARHFVEETETWSHENCKLACPCGGAKSDKDKCSWKAPEACSAEFMWKGVKYVGCATIDLEHDKPWCQHNFQHTEKQSDKYAEDWSYCTHSCSPDEPSTPEEDDGCEWVPAASCKKEFDYKGSHYVGCSGMDLDTPWCSETDPYNGKWSHCLYSCASKAEQKDPVIPEPSNVQPVPPKADTCEWTPAASCVTEFDYKGSHYVGCTGTDHDTPWCSNTGLYMGSWKDCAYTCANRDEKQEPVNPLPSNYLPVPPTQDTCEWTPAASCVKEFDYEGSHFVGCTGTDHDKPWCSNTDQYQGSWNHCIYTCATVPWGNPNKQPTLPKPDSCEWIPASSCVKEFDFEGGHYVGCSGTDLETPWCSNTDLYQGSWNYCISSCSNRDEKKEPVNPVPSDEQLCTWQPKPNCAKEFSYKGVKYTGCIEQDYPTPWCSLDEVHDGVFETCTRVCTSANRYEKDGSPAPTSVSAIQKQKMLNTFTQEQQPVSEDNLYNMPCNGTQAQGRCWFLSELSDNCATTCENQGRSFSYVISDPKHPVTPQLVKHTPKVKNEPWAALECYVPSEDRYHPANENAARHFAEGVETWSNENCKLACPCGGAASDQCSWKAPQSCSPEFMWKGVKYVGCATVDTEHEKPWCQHNFQHTDKESGNYAQDWSYCSYDCSADEASSTPELASPPVNPVPSNDLPSPSKQDTVPSYDLPSPFKQDTCEWTPAPSCVREFDYEGTRYVGCSGTDLDTPWCSNTGQYQGSWNHCIYTCANGDAKKELVKPVPSDNELCTWQPKPECAKAFKYKGVVHRGGCIEQDYPTPWCSLDEIHKGAFETCTKVCTSARVVEKEEPEPDCSWQPKLECAKAFEYKGVEYTGCIDEDHPMPWCSLDRIHKGAWETCTRVCSSPSLHVAPVPQLSVPLDQFRLPVLRAPVAPVPVAPVPAAPVPSSRGFAGDACDRQPGFVNDSIGNSATLDEIGFKLASAADSPVHMKRFICRVVGSVGCRATDLSALVAIVSYYTRAANELQYKTLETDLTTLCHAGGKFVMSQP